MSRPDPDNGTLYSVPQVRGLKRSREGENFDGLLQQIQDKHGIMLADEAQKMCWSPSKRANELGKCLAKMRQLYWRSPDMLSQSLELFDNLESTQHTVHNLLRIVEDLPKSGRPSPTKLFTEYRSSSGEDTEANTSFTISSAEKSNLTTSTERSPPSPRPLASHASNSPLGRGKSVPDDVPQAFSSDFEYDLDFSQLLADSCHPQNGDTWLRRRSSAAMVEEELDSTIDAEVKVVGQVQYPKLGHAEKVDPAWISTCPLLSQLDTGSSKVLNANLNCEQESPLKLNSESFNKHVEHYHLRELTRQGLFGK